ncbi:hypothetical protein FACS189426_02690 [Bacteroidia bacterium]|nr:hypothetical protein FACS189426_02690 [Bacteroidia bacterium]
MLQKELQQHQWKAFRRNPMFERNLGVRIFMYIMFAFLGLEFLAFGFVLDNLLLQIGDYRLAIDTFNSILLYVFAVDFTIKFFWKKDQSMQIAPYLSLPIKRNRLFDFLLKKEFSNFWNLYLLFLVIPFAFKSITPFFGFWAAVLYIFFFFLLCVCNSLIVSAVNSLIKRSFWFYILAAALVILPFAFPLVLKINLGDYTQLLGEQLLNYNLLVLAGLLLLIAGLWIINRLQMRTDIYNELQGEKADKISSFSSLSFLDRLGAIGDFINLELKMILRSPRLKQQVVFSSALIIGLFLYMLYMPNNAFTKNGPFIFFIYGIMAVGLVGIIMGQYIFTAESSFFDGLMTRKISAYELLKSKYFFYSGYSLLTTLILLVPVFHGKLNGFLLISIFFYTIGPIYFMIFQNAVYNKTYFDLFDKGMMNWKGQSGNMIVISMITMFLPVVVMLILHGIFGATVTYSFMLIVGAAFALTHKYWLGWTYRRFMKRRYKNMEGFRSNA